jgi:hypothetical protein
MIETAFCVTGWHFPEDFYQSLADLSEVDVYILSHKKKSEIPQYLFNLFEEKNILFRPNIGYDWGCYQQFLRSDIWRRYENIFFMHDDIKIKDFGFVGLTVSMLKEYAVVGNGKGEGTVGHTGIKLHPYAYAHSSWKPDLYSFTHSTVRGSFFATKREVLESIQTFEVYWDPFKVSIDFGNWSTKASCGKIEAVFGANSFGYLSQTFGESDYISEYFRGNTSQPSEELPGKNNALYRFIKRLAILYIELLYKQRQKAFRPLWLLVLKGVLLPFSSKIY